MNQPARADSLNDLLAQIAFMRVQRIRLVRFLSEVALTDIFSIPWLTMFQAHHSKCVFIRSLRPFAPSLCVRQGR
jgi:hypothetical protein